MKFAEIALLSKVRNSQDTFTYKIPTDMQVSVGDFVVVPLQAKQTHGIVMSIHETTPRYQTKDIISLALDSHSLPQSYIDFLMYMGKHTLHSVSNLAQAWLSLKPKRYTKSISQQNLQQHTPIASQVVLYNTIHELAPIIESQTHQRTGQIVIICPRIHEASKLAQQLSHLNPINYHDYNTSHERFALQERCIQGISGVYIGTRTLATLPFSNLTHLIIVDDNSVEHIQNEPTPHFSTTQISAFYETITNVSYISHTPSLETLHRVVQKELQLNPVNQAHAHNYTLFHHNAHTPLVSQALPQDAYEYLKMRLDLGKRIIVLCNKKGLYTGLFCRSCNTTTHDLSRLTCPTCKSPSVFAVGKGIDQIKEDLSPLFPQFSIETFSADTTSSPQAQLVIATQALIYSPHISAFDEVFILSFESLTSQLHSTYEEQHLENIFSIAQSHNLKVSLIAKHDLPLVWHHFLSHDLKHWYANKLSARKDYNLPPFYHLITCVYEDTLHERGLHMMESILSQLKTELPASCIISAILEKEVAKKHIFECSMSAPADVTLEFLSIIKKHPLKLYHFG
ncbi:hypothetical protein IT409_00155 [Candidatus Falkowbacteria bacterium]|nr:hypothetical protein [Candidatus Falkowbacteria bacterium]